MTRTKSTGTRALIYQRVSKADQDPKLQDDETRALVAARGYTLHDVVVDHGISGAKERRPGLDRVVEAARRRQFDVLIVWRADRAFRSLKHLVTLLDDLHAWGIQFVSVREPFDTTSPTGRLLLQIVGAMAEFERSLVQERTRAGVAAARRRGVRLGRPQVAVDVERALKLKEQGKGVRKIAAELGVAIGTLRRALAPRT